MQLSSSFNSSLIKTSKWPLGSHKPRGKIKNKVAYGSLASEAAKKKFFKQWVLAEPWKRPKGPLEAISFYPFQRQGGCKFFFSLKREAKEKFISKQRSLNKLRLKKNAFWFMAKFSSAGSGAFVKKKINLFRFASDSYRNRFFFCRCARPPKVGPFIYAAALGKTKKPFTKFNLKNNKWQNQTFWNQCFDKSRLKNFVIWFLSTYGEYRTVELIEQLKNVGFEYATRAGISLGIDDLKIPPKKSFLIFDAEKSSLIALNSYARGEITGVERFQKMIDTWHRTSEILKQEVIDYFEFTDTLNPVYMMAFSGARGNISQVRQLVGMRGLMANPQGQILDFPIRSNFREGLSLTEYIISTYGARKGIVDTALRTANAGYLTRRLVDVAQHIIVSNFDCGTKRGIFLNDIQEGNKILYSLQNRLVGRVLGKDIFNAASLGSQAISLNKNKKFFSIKLYKAKLNKVNLNISPESKKIKKEQEQFLFFRNTEISSELANKLSKISNKIFVRSTLTCETQKSVCQLCYGWSLAQGKLVSIGEAVGVVAAQSIGEPGTQLTMRTFHTGGVFSGDITDQIKALYNGIVKYLEPIAGTLIRTPEGKISFLTKTEGFLEVISKTNKEKKNFIVKKKLYKIPSFTLLYVRHGENVYEKQVIAQISNLSRQRNKRDDAEFTITSEIEGQFRIMKLNLLEKQIGPKPTLVAKKVVEKGWLASYNSNLSYTNNNVNNLKEKNNANFLLKKYSSSYMINQENSTMETLFEASDWGYAWILAGKIYQLPISSNLLPQSGDYVNKKSLINSIALKTSMQAGGACGFFENKLNNNFLLNKPILFLEINKMFYSKIGYFFKLPEYVFFNSNSFRYSFLKNYKTALPRKRIAKNSLAFAKQNYSFKNQGFLFSISLHSLKGEIKLNNLKSYAQRLNYFKKNNRYLFLDKNDLLFTPKSFFSSHSEDRSFPSFNFFGSVTSLTKNQISLFNVPFFMANKKTIPGRSLLCDSYINKKFFLKPQTKGQIFKTNLAKSSFNYKLDAPIYLSSSHKHGAVIQEEINKNSSANWTKKFSLFLEWFPNSKKILSGALINDLNLLKANSYISSMWPNKITLFNFFNSGAFFLLLMSSYASNKKKELLTKIKIKRNENHGNLIRTHLLGGGLFYIAFEKQSYSFVNKGYLKRLPPSVKKLKNSEVPFFSKKPSHSGDFDFYQNLIISSREKPSIKKWFNSKEKNATLNLNFNYPKYGFAKKTKLDFLLFKEKIANNKRFFSFFLFNMASPSFISQTPVLIKKSYSWLEGNFKKAKRQFLKNKTKNFYASGFRGEKLPCQGHNQATLKLNCFFGNSVGYQATLKTYAATLPSSKKRSHVPLFKLAMPEVSKKNTEINLKVPLLAIQVSNFMQSLNFVFFYFLNFYYKNLNFYTSKWLRQKPRAASGALFNNAERRTHLFLRLKLKKQGPKRFWSSEGSVKGRGLVKSASLPGISLLGKNKLINFLNFISSLPTKKNRCAFDAFDTSDLFKIKQQKKFYNSVATSPEQRSYPFYKGKIKKEQNLSPEEGKIWPPLKKDAGAPASHSKENNKRSFHKGTGAFVKKKISLYSDSYINKFFFNQNLINNKNEVLKRSLNEILYEKLFYISKNFYEIKQQDLTISGAKIGNFYLKNKVSSGTYLFQVKKKNRQGSEAALSSKNDFRKIHTKSKKAILYSFNYNKKKNFFFKSLSSYPQGGCKFFYKPIIAKAIGLKRLRKKDKQSWLLNGFFLFPLNLLNLKGPCQSLESANQNLAKSQNPPSGLETTISVTKKFINYFLMPLRYPGIATTKQAPACFVSKDRGFLAASRFWGSRSQMFWGISPSEAESLNRKPFRVTKFNSKEQSHKKGQAIKIKNKFFKIVPSGESFSSGDLAECLSNRFASTNKKNPVIGSMNYTFIFKTNFIKKKFKFYLKKKLNFFNVYLASLGLRRLALKTLITLNPEIARNGSNYGLDAIEKAIKISSEGGIKFLKDGLVFKKFRGSFFIAMSYKENFFSYLLFRLYSYSYKKKKVNTLFKPFQGTPQAQTRKAKAPLEKGRQGSKDFMHKKSYFKIIAAKLRKKLNLVINFRSAKDFNNGFRFARFARPVSQKPWGKIIKKKLKNKSLKEFFLVPLIDGVKGSKWLPMALEHSASLGLNLWLREQKNLQKLKKIKFLTYNFSYKEKFLKNKIIIYKHHLQKLIQRFRGSYHKGSFFLEAAYRSLETKKNYSFAKPWGSEAALNKKILIPGSGESDPSGVLAFPDLIKGLKNSFLNKILKSNSSIYLSVACTINLKAKNKKLISFYAPWLFMAFLMAPKPYLEPFLAIPGFKKNNFLKQPLDTTSEAESLRGHNHEILSQSNLKNSLDTNTNCEKLNLISITQKKGWIYFPFFYIKKSIMPKALDKPSFETWCDPRSYVETKKSKIKAISLLKLKNLKNSDPYFLMHKNLGAFVKNIYKLSPFKGPSEAAKQSLKKNNFYFVRKGPLSSLCYEGQRQSGFRNPGHLVSNDLIFDNTSCAIHCLASSFIMALLTKAKRKKNWLFMASFENRSFISEADKIFYEGNTKHKSLDTTSEAESLRGHKNKRSFFKLIKQKLDYFFNSEAKKYYFNIKKIIKNKPRRESLSFKRSLNFGIEFFSYIYLKKKFKQNIRIMKTFSKQRRTFKKEGHTKKILQKMALNKSKVTRVTPSLSDLLNLNKKKVFGLRKIKKKNYKAVFSYFIPLSYAKLSYAPKWHSQKSYSFFNSASSNNKGAVKKTFNLPFSLKRTSELADLFSYIDSNSYLYQKKNFDSPEPTDSFSYKGEFNFNMKINNKIKNKNCRFLTNQQLNINGLIPKKPIIMIQKALELPINKPINLKNEISELYISNKDLIMVESKDFLISRLRGKKLYGKAIKNLKSSLKTCNFSSASKDLFVFKLHLKNLFINFRKQWVASCDPRSPKGLKKSNAFLKGCLWKIQINMKNSLIVSWQKHKKLSNFNKKNSSFNYFLKVSKTQQRQISQGFSWLEGSFKKAKRQKWLEGIFKKAKRQARSQAWCDPRINFNKWYFFKKAIFLKRNTTLSEVQATLKRGKALDCWFQTKEAALFTKNIDDKNFKSLKKKAPAFYAACFVLKRGSFELPSEFNRKPGVLISALKMAPERAFKKSIILSFSFLSSNFYLFLFIFIISKKQQGRNRNRNRNRKSCVLPSLKKKTYSFSYKGYNFLLSASPIIKEGDRPMAEKNNYSYAKRLSHSNLINRKRALKGDLKNLCAKRMISGATWCDPRYTQAAGLLRKDTLLADLSNSGGAMPLKMRVAHPKIAIWAKRSLNEISFFSKKIFIWMTPLRPLLWLASLYKNDYIIPDKHHAEGIRQDQNFVFRKHGLGKDSFSYKNQAIFNKIRILSHYAYKNDDKKKPKLNLNTSKKVFLFKVGRAKTPCFYLLRKIYTQNLNFKLKKNPLMKVGIIKLRKNKSYNSLLIRKQFYSLLNKQIKNNACYAYTTPSFDFKIKYNQSGAIKMLELLKSKRLESFNLLWHSNKAKKKLGFNLAFAKQSYSFKNQGFLFSISPHSLNSDSKGAQIKNNNLIFKKSKNVMPLLIGYNTPYGVDLDFNIPNIHFNSKILGYDALPTFPFNFVNFLINFKKPFSLTTKWFKEGINNLRLFNSASLAKGFLIKDSASLALPIPRTDKSKLSHTWLAKRNSYAFGMMGTKKKPSESKDVSFYNQRLFNLFKKDSSLEVNYNWLAKRHKSKLLYLWQNQKNLWFFYFAQLHSLKMPSLFAQPCFSFFISKKLTNFLQRFKQSYSFFKQQGQNSYLNFFFLWPKRGHKTNNNFSFAKKCARRIIPRKINKFKSLFFYYNFLLKNKKKIKFFLTFYSSYQFLYKKKFSNVANLFMKCSFLSSSEGEFLKTISFSASKQQHSLKSYKFDSFFSSSAKHNLYSLRKKAQLILLNKKIPGMPSEAAKPFKSLSYNSFSYKAKPFWGSKIKSSSNLSYTNLSYANVANSGVAKRHFKKDYQELKKKKSSAKQINSEEQGRKSHNSFSYTSLILTKNNLISYSFNSKLDKSPSGLKNKAFKFKNYFFSYRYARENLFTELMMYRYYKYNNILIRFANHATLNATQIFPLKNDPRNSDAQSKATFDKEVYKDSLNSHALLILKNSSDSEDKKPKVFNNYNISETNKIAKSSLCDPRFNFLATRLTPRVTPFFRGEINFSESKKKLLLRLYDFISNKKNQTPLTISSNQYLIIQNLIENILISTTKLNSQTPSILEAQRFPKIEIGVGIFNKGVNSLISFPKKSRRLFLKKEGMSSNLKNNNGAMIKSNLKNFGFNFFYIYIARAIYIPLKFYAGAYSYQKTLSAIPGINFLFKRSLKKKSINFFNHFFRGALSKNGLRKIKGKRKFTWPLKGHKAISQAKISYSASLAKGLKTSHGLMRAIKLFKINQLITGLPQERSFLIFKNKLSLGEFYVYGDKIMSIPSEAAKKSFSDFKRTFLCRFASQGKGQKINKITAVATIGGQIIHINQKKITLRRAQPIFISPKSILHFNDGDFIRHNDPVMTLTYQRLKTGDIVQGIPKVEQYFEARITKQGRLFRDCLPNLLKGLFKRYRSQLPLEKAVRQSFYKIQQIIVDGVLRVYRSQGVTIADKHLEVIVRQMTSKVKIINGAQTGFFPGEIIDLQFVERVNLSLMKKIQYEPLILGITRAALEVDSFLSAASFQQTTRVLSSAAIEKKKDFLKGLKENILLGNLMPAGTGYLSYFIS